jgi:signal transduction histidine kinase
MTVTMDHLQKEPPDTQVPAEALHLLAQAADFLASGMDYEAILDSIAKLVVVNLANWCTIDLLLEGSIDRIAVAHRDPEKFHQTRFFLNKYPAKPTASRGVYRVVNTGEAILIPTLTQQDWAKRADDAEHLRLIMDLGSTSYMCVPLMARKTVVGAIALYSGERTYSHRELVTVQKLARNVGVAVDNVLMFRQMQAALTELKSTQAQLIQTAKVAALGVMTAGIAHELNNPLTIIKGRLSILEKLIQKNATPATEDIQLNVRKITQSTNRMTTIIGQVKDCTHRSPQEFGIVELDVVLRSAIALFQEQYPDTPIAIEITLTEGSYLIRGDAIRLEQVVLNVLSNAKDAIVLKENEESGVIQVSLLQVDGYLQLEFVDNGIGIEPHVMDRIFDPFFTTKAVGAGTGLGLTISNRIINDHNGTMEFSSIPSLSTRVRIRLPVVQQ